MAAQPDENENEADCSPFFACSGCAGFVGTTKSLHLEDPISDLQTYYQLVNKDTTQSFYNSFWQPPQQT
jgi:hypothetical protein